LLVLVVGGVRRPAGPVGTGALELGEAGAPVLGGAGQVGVLATEVVLLGAAAGELLLEPAEPLGGGGDQPVGLLHGRLGGLELLAGGGELPVGVGDLAVGDQ